MTDKKSIYIASAVCSALAFATTTANAETKPHYNVAKKRCYGAALKGKDDCGVMGAGKATKDCDPQAYMNANTEQACMDMMKKNCPNHAEKK